MSVHRARISSFYPGWSILYRQLLISAEGQGGGVAASPTPSLQMAKLRQREMPAFFSYLLSQDASLFPCPT